MKIESFTYEVSYYVDYISNPSLHGIVYHNE